MSEGRKVPFLDVSLRPSRSLSPRGFLMLMASMGAISAIAGIWFYAKGAWPVMGFFGLDMALLYWAFKVSYKRGELTERIRIHNETMTVNRAKPGRTTETWSMHPAWVTVSVEKEDEHDARLELRDRGKALVIGAFLPPKERAQVADVIRDGLSRRRAALMQ
ncbi:MAG: DUF2244 domain-containing protein [Sphingomonadales bacterium]